MRISDWSSDVCSSDLLDQVVGKVDRGDVRALARQRLAEQAAAAADVEHLRSTQRGAIGDVAKAHRVERVQRLLRALRFPPAACERGDLVELGLAEVASVQPWTRCCHSVHAFLMALSVRTWARVLP